MGDSTDRWFSLEEAFLRMADLSKLRRFDELATELGYGRNLFAHLSKPGGSSEYVWSRQYELRGRGKDASSICFEITDLFGSLEADFMGAGAAGRFSARGFIGGAMQTLDPLLFAMEGLRLRLDRKTIELPDGTVVVGIQIRINQRPQGALADGVATDNPNPSLELGESSSDKDPGRNQLSDDSRRRGRGRTPKPIWKGAESEAMRWLADEGCPLTGDGEQTRLERHIADWIGERGHYPAESTVRSHVARWINEFRASLP